MSIIKDILILLNYKFNGSTISGVDIEILLSIPISDFLLRRL